MDQELAAGAQALARGDWGGARAAYERVLAARPDHAEALYRLGSLLRDQGDLDEAGPLFRRALAADPGRPDVHADLGLLAWRLGDDETARPHLERALAGYPANLTLAGYLASTLDEAAATEVLARTLGAKPSWTAQELVAVGRELLVDPVAARAWRGAIATHVGASEEPWATVLALPEPRRVSACLIMRDEAPNLPRLLASLQGAYDELVVLDTGSQDDSVAIVEAAGARVGHFQWVQDFAAARNACLELARGDWIFMVDADHELDVRSRRALRRFLQRPPEEQGHLCLYQARIVEHMDVHDGNSYPHLAVFPNDPALRYEGAIHEQLRDARRRPLAIRPIPDLVLHHYGYARAELARQDKHARNLAILEAELAARPEDPFVHYNLGLQLRAGGAFAEAIAPLVKAVGLVAKAGGPLPPYVREAMILVADAQLRLERWRELAGTCAAGLSRFPDDADLLGLQGIARLAHGDAAGAIAPLERALAQAGRIATGVSNPELSGWVSRAALALALHLTGDEARSQAQATAFWHATPDQQAALNRLLRLGELAGQPAAVAAIMARIGVQVRVQQSPP